MNKATLKAIQEKYKISLSLSTAKDPKDFMRYRRDEHQNKYLLDDAGHIIGLNLRSNGLQDFDFDDVDLSELQALNLTENKLESLSLPALPNLKYLDLSDNKLLYSLEFEEALPALIWLDASDSGLIDLDLPAGFAALEKIDLSRNELTEIEVEGDFPQLKQIDLSGNKIKNFNPDILENFSKLKSFYLSNNPLNLSIQAYNKNNDPNYLSTLEKLKRALDKGERVKNDEYKILIVGDGKVGKTCFVTKLRGEEPPEEWDSTHGISIKQFNKDKPHKQKELNGYPYILNLWDFGGQDIYHDTHRLFMQDNTIYLLLWHQDSEKPGTVVTQAVKVGKRRKKPLKWRNRGIKYWMRYISHIGGKSPVIITQTKSPANKKSPKHPKEYEIRKRYESIFLAFCDIDSFAKKFKNTGFESLLAQIEIAIKDLDREEYLPKHWLDIRDAIFENQPLSEAASKDDFLDRDNNTISLEQYKAIATRFEEEDPMTLLTNWLVKTGIVYYKEGLFKNRIILNQEWAIKAIYTLFDREGGPYEEITDNKGLFTGEDLERYWEDHSKEERELFLSFMLTCEMCFEIKEKDKSSNSFKDRTFVAIELLPDKRPSGFETTEYAWNERPMLYLKYEYDFMPYGIIQRFIARTHEFAAVENIYKYGVLIKDEACTSLGMIDAYEGKNAIIIRTPLKGKMLFDKIRNEFGEIHKEQPFTKWVSLDGKIWVDFKKLQEKRNEEKIEAQCTTSVLAADYFLFLDQPEKHVFVSAEEKNKKRLAEKAQEQRAILDKVQAFIEGSELGEALTHLSTIAEDEAVKDDISLQKSRWTTLNKEIDRDTISSSEARQEKNKLRLAIQSLMKQVKSNLSNNKK